MLASRLAAVFAVVVVACGTNLGGASSSGTVATTGSGSDTTQANGSSTVPATTAGGECAPFDGEPFGSVQSAQSVVLAEDIGGLKV